MTARIQVRRAGWAVAALACWAIGGGTAGAQPQGTLTLDRAVGAVMERSPEVLTAREEVALREGRVREANGLFNLRLRLGTSLEHTDQYLSARSWFFEWRRRHQLEVTNKALTQVRVELENAIKNGGSNIPICPEGFQFIQRSTDPTRADQAICRPVTSDPLAVNFGTIETSAFEASSLFLPPPSTGFDPQRALSFVRRYAQINGLSIPDYVEDKWQQGSEQLLNIYRLVREYEQLTALWRQRLEGIPDYEVDNILRVSGDLIKPFRSGGALGFSAVVDGTESKYRNRSMDPDFGGKGVENRFTGKIELLFQQPLMRGRGTAAVRAAERSARQNLEASRFTYVHRLSEGVRDTTLAYLDVLAAQQTLALLEEELATQRRMLDAATRLSAAGAMARVETTRMQARTAEVESGVAQARQALVAARAALAQTAGLSAADIAGDVRPTDRFPDVPPPVDVDAMLRAGLSNRFDVRAAEASRESARILVAAARTDTRPRFDLQMHAGYASGYYGTFFRILRDEYPYTTYHCTPDWTDTSRPCFEPGDSPLNFYNPAGVWRAWSDRKWEPEAGIQFTFELPFGNNRALGRLRQAQASVQRADVQVADLARVTAENSTRQAASLQRAREEWLRRQEAVEQHQVTWSDTEKRRAAGDMTLIDTLQTERDLTNARLQLVQAKRDYAAALALLRFETGMLVTVRNDRPEPDLSGIVAPR